MRSSGRFVELRFVDHSYLDKKWRGTRVGEIMYLKLIEELSKKSCALVPGSWPYGGGDGTGTSSSALRVWKSLSKHCKVIGYIAWGGNGVTFPPVIDRPRGFRKDPVREKHRLQPSSEEVSQRYSHILDLRYQGTKRSASLPEFVYHGTTTAEQDGLERGQTDGLLYLTSDYDNAVEYAKEAARDAVSFDADEPPIAPIVLRFSLAKLARAGVLEPDWKWLDPRDVRAGISWQEALRKKSQVTFQGRFSSALVRTEVLSDES